MEIEIKNLSKTFGERKVFDGLSLTLPARGILRLKGPSGCGKTTLLRIIAGLESADSGEVNGIGNKRISMQFQEDRLLPWLNALDNICVVCENDVRQKAMDTMLRFGLEKADFFRFPDELSGGMNRRVNLARCIVYGGDIYILDEPFQGIDPKTRHNIFEDIKALSQNALVLVATHDEEEARLLGGENINLLKLESKNC